MNHASQTAVPDSHRDRLGKTLDQTQCMASKAKDAGIALSVLALVGFALTACASPIPSHRDTAIPRCAELQARALISPNAPVVGSFACLDSSIAEANHFTSDADLQAIAAAPPVYTSYRYLGHTLNGYYFEFSSDQTVAGCFRFHVDTKGTIDKVASKSGACPHPLP
jgi:hypothetical protein